MDSFLNASISSYLKFLRKLYIKQVVKKKYARTKTAESGRDGGFAGKDKEHVS